MQTNTITIIGMRRTGTSIALALKEGALDFTLIGHDSDSDLLHETAVTEAVDRVEADLIKACLPADIIVLAMPSVVVRGKRSRPEDLEPSGVGNRPVGRPRLSFSFASQPSGDTLRQPTGQQ